jgi:hypothetical protein
LFGKNNSSYATNEIKEATPFESLLVQTAPTVSHLLLYFVCLSGILVCLLAFRKSQKTGYLIVGVYFLHPLIAFLLGHMFSHAAVAPQQTATPTDLSPHIQNLNISLRLPIYDFLILLGVWLLAKKGRRLKREMKSKKKKVAFPRRTWQINPVTRVKSSAKKYSRPRVKQDLQKSDE